MLKDKTVLLLAGDWDTTGVVYEALRRRFARVEVIIEDGGPRSTFLRRRAAKLGWPTVIGQVLFSAAVAKPQRAFSAHRIDEILKSAGFATVPQLETIPHQRVSSMNEASTVETVAGKRPDLVVVHGTRILSKKLLAAIQVPVVNIHAGITPRYRGSHGGYWALANGDAEHCGVTLHCVDAGIDTGAVLAQALIHAASADNFSTYPYLQLVAGLRLLDERIEDLLEGRAETFIPQLDSKLWYHPTLWGYWATRLRRGVR